MNPLACAVYLLWIAAGVADFLLHRRSDIPHTSGLKENRLHLVQLLLAAVAIGGWLFLQHTWLVWSALAVAAVAHAVIGYADTRSAYRIRSIVPLEQHVHSVLDVAPWILLGWAATRIEPHHAGLSIHLPEWGIAVALLLPAIAPTALALLERRACLEALRTVDASKM